MWPGNKNFDPNLDPNRSKTLKDVVLFGRVLSTGLLVGGYVFLGVYLSSWLEGKGWPRLLVALTPVAVTLFGLWQGWLFLKQFGKKNGNGKK